MVRLIEPEELKGIIPYREAITAVERAFREWGKNPVLNNPRQRACQHPSRRPPFLGMTGYMPLNIQLKKMGYRELFYAGKILHEPLTGLVASSDKIKNNPQQIRKVMRAFVRGMNAFKTERASFVSFTQKKFSLSKDVAEEAYDYMVDSLSSDRFVEDTVIENAILTAKKMLGVSKPVSPADIVDYSFLREVVKKYK